MNDTAALHQEIDLDIDLLNLVEAVQKDLPEVGRWRRVDLADPATIPAASAPDSPPAPWSGFNAAVYTDGERHVLALAEPEDESAIRSETIQTISGMNMDWSTRANQMRHYAKAMQERHGDTLTHIVGMDRGAEIVLLTATEMDKTAVAFNASGTPPRDMMFQQSELEKLKQRTNNGQQRIYNLFDDPHSRIPGVADTDFSDRYHPMATARITLVNPAGVNDQSGHSRVDRFRHAMEFIRDHNDLQVLGSQNAYLTDNRSAKVSRQAKNAMTPHHPIHLQIGNLAAASYDLDMFTAIEKQPESAKKVGDWELIAMPNLGRMPVKGDDGQSYIKPASGFKAGIYRHTVTGACAGIFAGTEKDGSDWATNFAQARNSNTAQYQQNMIFAKQAKALCGENLIVFGGHSLGGSLTIPAVLSESTGNVAGVVFNSAEVREKTLERSGIHIEEPINSPKNITSYVYKRDPLDWVNWATTNEEARFVAESVLPKHSTRIDVPNKLEFWKILAAHSMENMVAGLHDIIPEHKRMADHLRTSTRETALKEHPELAPVYQALDLIKDKTAHFPPKQQQQLLLKMQDKIADHIQNGNPVPTFAEIVKDASRLAAKMRDSGVER